MKKEKENSLMVKMIRNQTQKQMIWVIQRSAKNLYYKKTQTMILNHPYYKANFKSLDLSRASFFYYNRERNRLNRQKERLKHNKKLLAIQNNYPLINLQDLAFYSILVGLFNFKGVSKDFEKLEKIVSIVLNQEQGITINDKFRNQKYIKHIQNEHKNIDVLAIASYLNEIKQYTFRSKEQAEYLDSIIKMTKQWIVKKIKDLKQKYPNDNNYKQIEKFVDNDVYRSMLWNLKVENENLIFDLTKLNDKNGKIEKINLMGGEKFKINQSNNSFINISQPQNEFQKKIVSWYNEELNNINL